MRTQPTAEVASASPTSCSRATFASAISDVNRRRSCQRRQQTLVRSRLCGIVPCAAGSVRPLVTSGTFSRVSTATHNPPSVQVPLRLLQDPPRLVARSVSITMPASKPTELLIEWRYEVRSLSSLYFCANADLFQDEDLATHVLSIVDRYFSEATEGQVTPSDANHQPAVEPMKT
jgi:hypothetical protein